MIFDFILASVSVIHIYLRLPYFLRFVILFIPCSPDTQACGGHVLFFLFLFAIDTKSRKLDNLFDDIYLWNRSHHIPMSPHTERMSLNSASEFLGWI